LLRCELIEPTGTLQEPEKAWGSLTIFRGPPQTEIYLDGEKVGLREVETGLHTLNYILDFSWRI